jgi:hypothetical protein
VLDHTITTRYVCEAYRLYVERVLVTLAHFESVFEQINHLLALGVSTVLYHNRQ